MGTWQRIGVVAACAAFALAPLTLAGCSKASTESDSEASSTAPADDRKGYGMGGVEQKIAITRSAIENQPERPNLKTPEDAVRSYLDWISYAYRIAESQAATPTMTPAQEVRVDAYAQMNLQKERLLDQKLGSITFGTATVKGKRAILPAKEKWTYRYVSIKEADKTLEGPLPAEYETKYILVKTDAGWVVDDVEVKALGTIK